MVRDCCMQEEILSSLLTFVRLCHRDSRSPMSGGRYQRVRFSSFPLLHPMLIALPDRFVGDAAAAWKKSTVFDDFSSRCVCSPLNGCDESCQNRIMLYECDDGNCSAGPE